MPKVIETSFVASGKQNFDKYYAQADPRDYYVYLRQLDYCLPDLVLAVLQCYFSIRCSCDRTRHGTRPGHLQVLDLACGFGVVPFLAKTAKSYRELVDYYAHAQPRPKLELNESFVQFFGQDISRAAIDHALELKLYDEAFCENWETNDISQRAAMRIKDIDFIVEVGGIGYITEATVSRLLSVGLKEDVTLILSPTQVSNFEPIKNCLEKHGFLVEKLPHSPFPHRKFASEHERQNAMKRLIEFGLEAKQSAVPGYFLADIFVAAKPSNWLYGPKRT